jgi:hypothetical protein
MANFVRAEELLEELRDKSFDSAKVRHSPQLWLAGWPDWFSS